MSDSSMAKKLGMKPYHKVLALNALDNYEEMLGPLPEGVQVDTGKDGGKEAYDVVHAFVRSKTDVDKCASAALMSLKPGGLLWFSYPKKSSKVKTDISRDTGWESLNKAGWQNIAQVSVDDTWSAGRFRPAELIKSSK